MADVRPAFLFVAAMVFVFANEKSREKSENVWFGNEKASKSQPRLQQQALPGWLVKIIKEALFSLKKFKVS